MPYQTACIVSQGISTTLDGSSPHHQAPNLVIGTSSPLEWLPHGRGPNQEAHGYISTYLPNALQKNLFLLITHRISAV